jgi:hypothetical protein
VFGVFFTPNENSDINKLINNLSLFHLQLKLTAEAFEERLVWRPKKESECECECESSYAEASKDKIKNTIIFCFHSHSPPALSHSAFTLFSAGTPNQMLLYHFYYPLIYLTRGWRTPSRQFKSDPKEIFNYNAHSRWKTPRTHNNLPILILILTL